MTTSAQGTLVHSYLFLRRAIGAIGIALPFLLILGKIIIDGGGLLDSISGYYYTNMRDVFVGSMCAVGVFLFSYRGLALIDDIAGNVAAVGAVGVALFPTTSPQDSSATDHFVGVLHIVFAAIFFLTLAFFCLFLFTKTDKDQLGQQKIKRNAVYLTSGSVILACLLLIVISNGLLTDAARTWHPVLWLESLAILAFGFAWLTKGETILRDGS